MAAPPTIIDTRYDQMFPTLDEADLARLGRFSDKRSFADGEYLVLAGDAGLGLFVVISGEVVISRHEGTHATTVTPSPASHPPDCQSDRRARGPAS